MSDFERRKLIVETVCGLGIREKMLSDEAARCVIALIADNDAFSALNVLLQEQVNSYACACYDRSGEANGYKANAIGELREALIRARRCLRGEESDLIADSEIPSAARDGTEVKDAMDSYGVKL